MLLQLITMVWHRVGLHSDSDFLLGSAGINVTPYAKYSLQHAEPADIDTGTLALFNVAAPVVLWHMVVEIVLMIPVGFLGAGVRELVGPLGAVIVTSTELFVCGFGGKGDAEEES